MITAYVDTNVFLYAIGTAQQYRNPCREIVEAIGEGRLHAEISVVVVTELLGILRRRAVPGAPARARDVTSLVSRVHDVTAEDVEVALAIAERHRELSTSDALHAAIARRRGIGVILSADPDFDGISGLRRVDPLDRAGVAALHA